MQTSHSSITSKKFLEDSFQMLWLVRLIINSANKSSKHKNPLGKLKFKNSQPWVLQMESFLVKLKTKNYLQTEELQIKPYSNSKVIHPTFWVNCKEPLIAFLITTLHRANQITNAPLIIALSYCLIEIVWT